jgi:PAS domain S-box-containing protein
MENTIDPSKPAALRVLAPLLLTLASILVTLGMDSFYGAVTSAPLIGVCTLFLLALKYDTRVVFICLLPLTIFTALKLWSTAILPGGTGVDILRFFIRMATFLAAGGLAVSASAYRSRLDGLRLQMLRVLESIPAPLIITDSSGFIQAVSHEAVVASGQTRENLVGFKIQDICGSHLLEEADEDWYQHWMKSPADRSFEVELQLGGRRSIAKVGRVGAGRQTIMIVTFLS